jgi:hypothetical protein
MITSELVLHGHHYNARLQHTVEAATAIDGKHIIRSSAATVFADLGAASWQDAAARHAQHGLGELDTTRIAAGTAAVTSSYFVDAWNASLPGRSQPVCTVTEGFLAGVHHAITGAPQCVFERTTTPAEPIEPMSRRPFAFAPKSLGALSRSGAIDGDRIAKAIDAKAMRGIALGVYVARLPADLYSSITVRFLESMMTHGLARNALRLLVSDAEIGALHTCRAITSSAEWIRIVEPMIQRQDDIVRGLTAVSRALGWATWYVRAIEPTRLRIESVSGYESLGFRSMRAPSHYAQCSVLRGVAAGMMAHAFGNGSIRERFGSYAAVEESCICRDHESCVFDVVRS